MILDVSIKFFSCVIAVFFYSRLMNSPKHSIVYASVTAGAGYAVYYIIFTCLGNELLGYFVGTLVISILGEILARIKKMPSTIFILPAVIPLVPGIGLYKTMLLFVRNDINNALAMLLNTIAIAGVIAAAIALTNVVVRNFIKIK